MISGFRNSKINTSDKSAEVFPYNGIIYLIWQ